MVLQAFGQDRLDAARDLRNQHGVGGVRCGRVERVPHRDDPAVDDLDQVDEQAQQGGDRALVPFVAEILDRKSVV